MLSQHVTCTIAAVQLFLDFQKAEEEDDRIKDKLPANSFLGVIRHSKSLQHLLKLSQNQCGDQIFLYSVLYTSGVTSVNGQIGSHFVQTSTCVQDPSRFKVFQSNAAKLAGQQPGARLLYLEYTCCICMCPSKDMSEPKAWEASASSLP